jgi:hypothetical protein
MHLQKYDSLTAVAQLFEVQLKKYVGHIFRVRHQYRQIRIMRDSLQKGEIALHVDFSINHPVKAGAEVQALHFGNRQQVVIHKGVLYMDVSKE